MSVAIIGTGRIGCALGNLISRAGHEVVFGSSREQPGAMSAGRVVGVDEAIRGGEVVVVAIPFGSWPVFAQDHGASIGTKIVIDTSNPDARRDGSIVDEVERYDLGTLSFVARLLPRARLVKAFNTMASAVLVEQTVRPEGPLAHPIAGDDPASVERVARLVRDIGFEAVLVGGAASARRFDRGTPAWNHPMTAPELARVLGTL